MIPLPNAASTLKGDRIIRDLYERLPNAADDEEAADMAINASDLMESLAASLMNSPLRRKNSAPTDDWMETVLRMGRLRKAAETFFPI